jgi:chaperonin GroES
MTELTKDEQHAAAVAALAATIHDPYTLEAIRPVASRLIIAPLPVATASKSGLFLVDTGDRRERPQEGIVLAGGRQALGELDLQLGDLVGYGQYSGQVQTLAGRNVLSMSHLEVFYSVPRAAFTLVEHDDDPRKTHLKGTYCDICASPAEKAAADRLQAMRDERLEEQRREKLAQLANAMQGLDVQKLEPSAVHTTDAGLEAATVHPDDEARARAALDAERERARQLRAIDAHLDGINARQANDDPEAALKALEPLDPRD